MPIQSFQFGSPAAAQVLIQGAGQLTDMNRAREQALQEMISRGAQQGYDAYQKRQDMAYQQEKDAQDRQEAELNRIAQANIEELRQKGETERLNSSLGTQRELGLLEIEAKNRGITVNQLIEEMRNKTEQRGQDYNWQLGKEQNAIQSTDVNNRYTLGQSGITADMFNNMLRNASAEKIAESEIAGRERMNTADNQTQRDLGELTNATNMFQIVTGDKTENRRIDVQETANQEDVRLREQALQQQLDESMRNNDTSKTVALINVYGQMMGYKSEEIKQARAIALERQKMIQEDKQHKEEMGLRRFEIGTNAAINLGQLGQRKADSRAERAASYAPQIQEAVLSDEEGNFDKILPTLPPEAQAQAVEALLGRNVTAARAKLDKHYGNNILSATEINDVLGEAIKSASAGANLMSPQQLLALDQLTELRRQAGNETSWFGGKKISGEQAAMVYQRMQELLGILQSGNGETTTYPLESANNPAGFNLFGGSAPAPAAAPAARPSMFNPNPFNIGR